MDNFEPDYEFDDPVPEMNLSLPKMILISTDPDKNIPRAVRTDKDWRKSLIIIKREADIVTVNPHPKIIDNITVKNEEISYNGLLLDTFENIKTHLEHNSSMFTLLKLKWCSTCQELFYTPQHKKQKDHIDTAKKLQQLTSNKAVKSDPKNKYIEIVTAERTQEDTTCMRKIIFNDKPAETTINVHLKNITSRKIYILSCCGSNKDKGHIRFVDGQPLGDNMIYEVNQTLAPKEIAAKKIKIHCDNVCASTDLALEILFCEVDNNKRKRLSKTITIYNMYSGRFYNSEIKQRDPNMWKGYREIKFDEEEYENSQHIAKTSLLQPGWNTPYKHLEFQIEQQARRKISPLLSPDEEAILHTIKQNTNKDNLIQKLTAVTLAELSFFFSSQVTTSGTVTGVQKCENGELVYTNIKNVTTSALYLKTGDRALIMVRDCIILPAKVKVVDSEETVFIVKDCNTVKSGDVVQVSPTLRIQPFTLTLSVLEQLQSNPTYVKNVGKFFTPSDPILPTQQESRDVYEFENSSLDESQRTAVTKTLKSAPGAPLIIVGPPGTGKTTTLIEIIIQSMKEGMKVLVCCPTNTSVCNLQYKLSCTNYFRTHDKKITKFATPSMKVVQQCYQLCTSVLVDGNTRHTFPKPSAIKEADVMISTLASSHRLGNLKEDNSTYWKRFDLIVVDEASFALESSILIPISTQILNNHQNFKLLLLGDPEQIRQLPRSYTGKQAPADDIISRLLKEQLYLFTPSLHHRLIANYRNAKLITHSLKRLVYGEQMTSKSDFPGEIHFYHVESTFSDIKGRSKHSLPEALKCFEIFMARKRENVTPIFLCYYSAQSSVILAEAKLQKFPNFHQISVTTAESIQGNESDEVIITFCGPLPNNPWQSDRRRLNVLLSRGKLRINIVGNLHYLASNDTTKYMLFEALNQGTVEGPTAVITMLTKKLSAF